MSCAWTALSVLVFRSTPTRLAYFVVSIMIGLGWMFIPFIGYRYYKDVRKNLVIPKLEIRNKAGCCWCCQACAENCCQECISLEHCCREIEAQICCRKRKKKMKTKSEVTAVEKLLFKEDRTQESLKHERLRGHVFSSAPKALSSSRENRNKTVGGKHFET